MEAAQLPLKASFAESVFQSKAHRGADDLPQVIVAFNQPVASIEGTTPSVSLTGATVHSLNRHEEDGVDNAWLFFLDPAGNEDIRFSLVTGQPCDAGGICTSNGTTLSAVPEPLVILGPEVNSPATGAPTITGTARVGETLTADTSGIADENGLSNVTYGYQWQADSAVISGATDSTYTLVADDEGKAVSVVVSFTDDTGNEETLTSAATAAVEAIPNSPATGTPTISGIVHVGETFTADVSGIADADGLTNAVFSYQWIVNEESDDSTGAFYTVVVADDGSTTWVPNEGTTDTDIEDATGSRYTLTEADEGRPIRVRVSFTDDSGNTETVISAPTLMAGIDAAPASHDGENVFTFELRFSEEFGLSYETLRDHAFTVTGGTVKEAQRLDKPSNILWRITVRPNTDGQVTITLPITEDCDAQGAICTDDGRKLSNELVLTVSGP